MTLRKKLEQAMIDRDWTLVRLTEEIQRRTGVKRHYGTWQRFIDGTQVPNRRTKAAVDRFFLSLEAERTAAAPPTTPLTPEEVDASR